MPRQATKSTPITLRDFRTAASLATEFGISDWARLATALGEHTGKPITRRELAEAVRKSLQPAAKFARRQAAQAVKDAMAAVADKGRTALFPEPPG